MILSQIKKSPPFLGGSFFCFRICIFLLLWVVINNGFAQSLEEPSPDDRKVSWQLHLHAERFSDPLDLKYFGTPDWAKHVHARNGRNAVMVEHALEMTRSVSGSPHQWSILARQLGRLSLNEDSARRIAQIVGVMDEEKEWQAYADVDHKAFSGAGFGWKFVAPDDLNGFYIEGGVQALLLKSLTVRQVQGLVDFNSVNQRYAFNMENFHSGSNLDFPFQKPYSSSGYGLLFQGGVGWRSANWQLKANLRDVGLLHWSDIPHQTLILNTDNQKKDANGFIVYKPLVNGQNSQSSVRWQAPWTGSIDLMYKISNQQKISLPWQYIPKIGLLPALRWQDQTRTIRWALTGRAYQRDLVTQLQWQNWQLAFSLGQFERSQLFSLAYVKSF